MRRKTPRSMKPIGGNSWRRVSEEILLSKVYCMEEENGDPK
jgi:hypothetical protein